MLTRLVLALLWLIHFLPLSWLARIGRGLGALLYRLGDERRGVALTNLRLCFPNMSESEREALARRHFAAFGRSVLERGLLWWAGPERIRRLVQVRGTEHLAALGKRPVILLVPHFVGLDMGWTRLTLDMDMVSIYANQKNLMFNAAFYRGRTRFGASLLFSRQEGTRKAIRAMREGLPFYYLPDMDFGQRDTIFVPFFGFPAATITGLSRLVRKSRAAVVPCLTRMLPGDAGYEVELLPAWEDFPGENIEADTRRMNTAIEAWVREMPEQYFWVHKRFKTRPPGESRVY
jgi:KDO2-lipid IV(A) lauroyltransferase